MPLDTRVSLHKLEVFCVVAELGSVTRAAEQLFVAQPVVSAHLKSLEQRVGATLLQRRGNRMLLTEPGAAVHDWARAVLTRSRAMEREVDGLANGSRGVAVVATSMTVGSYMLPGVVAAFSSERPGTRITLLASDPEHAAAAAESGEADFAVLIGDEEDHLAHGSLVTEHLADEPLVLVAAPDGPPAPDELSITELSSLPFVASPGGLSRQRIVARRLASVGLGQLDVAIELGHPEAMKRAVRSGLGLSFLFRSSVREELERGDLREIAVRDAQLTAPVLLLHRRDRRMSLMQQQLLADVRGALQG